MVFGTPWLLGSQIAGLYSNFANLVFLFISMFPNCICFFGMFFFHRSSMNLNVEYTANYQKKTNGIVLRKQRHLYLCQPHKTYSTVRHIPIAANVSSPFCCFGHQLPVLLACLLAARTHFYSAVQSSRELLFMTIKAHT